MLRMARDPLNYVHVYELSREQVHGFEIKSILTEVSSQPLHYDQSSALESSVQLLHSFLILHTIRILGPLTGRHAWH